MDLFSELIQAVQDDLTIGDESTLFPLAVVKRAINRSYIKCGALFRWPETEDAQKTSSRSGWEYYDYPQNWRPDSIWKLTIAGVRYGEDPDGGPLAFEDYLVWKEDNPDATDKKWANHWRRFFVSPTPTADGDFDMVIWGQRIVDQLEADGDVTIWSYSMPECNDAVVDEAVAILKNKGEEPKNGQFYSAKAQATLVIAWGKVRQENTKYKKIQPFFYVPDMFSGKSALAEQITGNF